jgi:hypothetical protein
MPMGRGLALSIAAILLLGASASAQTQPAAPELTLEQLLTPRGFSAVQLRENVYGQLEADVLLNGEHRLRVGVSTSFSKTIFDAKAIEKLGLTVEPTNVELSGPAKKQRLGSVPLKSLSLGETSLGAVTIFTADLSAFVSQSGAEPVAGMIGSDLLTKYQAVLEIPTAKLYLRVR